MYIEMNQGVWWEQSLGKYGLLYFVKHKNDMHASAALQKL